MERKQEETIEKEKKTQRDVYTAYICARCDTDFGINEHGCMLKTFTYALVCPICGYNKFHVYYVVDDRTDVSPKERGFNERPPLATTEELQGLIDEDDEKDEW